MQITPVTFIHSALNSSNICPVCGYGMEYPPLEFNICPSCGTEFEDGDDEQTLSVLREAWVESGPVWWSPVDPVPDNWSPREQFDRVRTSVTFGSTGRFTSESSTATYGTMQINNNSPKRL